MPQTPDAKTVLRDIVARKLPCVKCGKPHPWRCTNPKHRPWFSGGQHSCRVKSCRAIGTFVAPDCDNYRRLTAEEYAAEKLRLIDGADDAG
jgi:hypothetical protein